MVPIHLPDHPHIPADLPGLRVVAYLDILGMRALIQELFAAMDVAKYRQVLEILWSLTANAQVADQGTLATPLLRANAFSDTIVFSDEFTPLGVQGVVKRAGLLASSLMPLGIFCRGAIDAGRTYHDGGLILGEGLISAYDLESTAIYPRIVVSRSVIELADEATRHGFSHLYEDCDGMWCVDAFFQLRKAHSIREALSRPIGDPEWDPQLFVAIGHHITKALASVVDNPKLLAKYRWLATAFNDAVDRYVSGAVEHVDLERPQLGA